MVQNDFEHLRTENAELRRRVDVADSAIEELRHAALARRTEVRRMAEALPAEVSRHALIRSALTDVRRHPDKRGVALRAIRKLGRAPGKMLRIARRRE